MWRVTPAPGVASHSPLRRSTCTPPSSSHSSATVDPLRSAVQPAGAATVVDVGTTPVVVVDTSVALGDGVTAPVDVGAPVESTADVVEALDPAVGVEVADAAFSTSKMPATTTVATAPPATARPRRRSTRATCRTYRLAAGELVQESSGAECGLVRPIAERSGSDEIS